MSSEPAASAEAASQASPFPFVALVLGAMAMGISPIFVRLADVGPFASAFWRVAGALPLLYVWAAWDAKSGGRGLGSIWRFDRAILLAGLFFVTDLLFWHLAILNTTVANATFLATMAPVWVALGSSFFIGEKVGRGIVGGLAICLAGAAFLVGTTYSLTPGHLAGDLYGIATSVFFGAYFLAVRSARRRFSAAHITFLSTVITSVVLFVVAYVVEGRILPQSTGGIAALAALAVISHAGGQGFLAYALGHLPAAFSALVIFLEAIFAAFFGWAFLSEPVSFAQGIGGALILAGIFVARPRRGH